jgi:hypothetical protein
VIYGFRDADDRSPDEEEYRRGAQAGACGCSAPQQQADKDESTAVEAIRCPACEYQGCSVASEEDSADEPELQFAESRLLA